MTRKPRAIGEVVGANIRMYRAKLSLTQSQLAEKIGIEPMSLSRIERGVAAPSLERLDLIARSLKVLPSDLLHELADSAAPKEQAEIVLSPLISHMYAAVYLAPLVCPDRKICDECYHA